MTKLHQFHLIVENIRFTTEDLEALRSPYRGTQRGTTRSIQNGDQAPGLPVFYGRKKQQRKPQTAQAHEFYIYAGAYRLLIYGSFNKGILGLEKSRKRHPNSFKTRHIAIKPPTTLLSSLLSPPHCPPPPPLKKRNS